MTTYILGIETATEICSVALCRNEEVIAIEETAIENSHSQTLLPFVDKVLENAKIKTSELSAIAVSKGPGSYTGLRIGVSAAKGLCYGLSIPLLAIDTLKAIAAQTLPQDPTTLICPMIDARRMEVYYALYNHLLQQELRTSNQIVDECFLSNYFQEHTIVFCGNANTKTRPLLRQQPKAIFVERQCSASTIALLGYQQYKEKEFADLAYFEPFYLKAYQSAISKIKGLD